MRISAKLMATDTKAESGDGANQPSSRPVILVHPTDIYIIRSDPATINCRAIYARRIRFKCLNQWVGVMTRSHLPNFKLNIIW